MAKKIDGYIKLQIPAGGATPSPPVGPALGQKGIQIMDFCKAFNAATESQKGMIIPVVITVYADKSFTFITKTPPAAVLIRKALNLQKGSGEPNKSKVGKLMLSQVKEIAETKMKDLNAASVETAMEMIKGTARSMGVVVEGGDDENVKILTEEEAKAAKVEHEAKAKAIEEAEKAESQPKPEEGEAAAADDKESDKEKADS